MHVSVLSGQLLLMFIGRGCLQKRNLLAKLLFPQAILLLEYSAVKQIIPQMSDCNSSTTQKYLEVRKDAILNTSQYCNAVTKRQNLHQIEFMELQYIKNVWQVFHCAWLGLGLSGSDLLLLVLVLVTKLIAGVVTLIYYLSCFRNKCHSHEPWPSCSRCFTTMRQKYGLCSKSFQWKARDADRWESRRSQCIDTSLCGWSWSQHNCSTAAPSLSYTPEEF